MWILRRALPVLLVVTVIAAYAEKGILVVRVHDIHNRPIAGVQVGTAGDGSIEVTDKSGRARIHLASQTRAGDWVTLQIVVSPKGRDLTLLSASEGRRVVPPFENESDNFVDLLVVERGDLSILQSASVIETLVARVMQSIGPKLSNQPSNDGRRQEVLQEVAKSLGLSAESVDMAIQAWAAHADNPYQKGLAALYKEQYAEASQWFSLSLNEQKMRLAQEQERVVSSALFLGQSLYRQGDYKKSAEAFREGLNLRPGDPLLLSELAMSLLDLGDLLAAESILRQVLAFREKTLAPDHPEVATIAHNLAQTLKMKGNYSEAEALYRRGLTIAERSLGINHWKTATHMNDLGLLLLEIGKYNDSEFLIRRAMIIRQRVRESVHEDIANSFLSVCSLHYEKDELDLAEPSCRQSLDIAKKALGQYHPHVATVLNNLANILRAKGQLQRPSFFIGRP